MTVPMPPYQQQWAPPVRRRPRHPEAKLGGFTVMDWVTLVAYVSLMFGLPLVMIMAFGSAVEDSSTVQSTPEEDIANFVVNLALYAILFTLAFIACRREFVASFKTFLWYPWIKGFGIPVAWIATLVASGVIISVYATLTGGNADALSESANQEAADSMMQTVPFGFMALMVVAMGPLVEEYIFRHLLIGKLSRWINKWILVVVSAAAFMSLHFIGKEWPTVYTGTAYFVMGLSFGIGYVLAGKSLAYSYSLHAFSNLMALIITYATM